MANEIKKVSDVLDREERFERDEMEERKDMAKIKIKKGKKIFKIGVAVIILAIIGGGIYYFKFSKTPEERAAEQVAEVVKQASKLMILPAGTPMLATVQDAAALKAQQPFFANAVNGDELLMFAESRQAIIFSPSRNIIVNVGPIQYDGGKTTSVTPTPTPEPSPAPVPTKTTTTTKKR